MRSILWILFLLTGLNSFAQVKTFDIGVLPAEYAEGMPPLEFLEIEEKIMEEIDKIPRYNLVKLPEDYYEVEKKTDLFSEFEAIRKQGKESNVPYLLQIVFGDTEWYSEQVEVVVEKAVVKDGKEVKPAKTKKYWHHAATLWVTLNLYSVETGGLADSETFNSEVASKTTQFTTARKPKPQQDFQTAVTKSKGILLNRLKSGIKKLSHLNADLLKVIEEDKKGIRVVRVQAGQFHGLNSSDRLYMYYENEHLINGQKIIREVHAGNLIVTETKEFSALCEVRKGKKRLQQLLKEGKKIKCNFEKSYNHGF